MAIYDMRAILDSLVSKEVQVWVYAGEHLRHSVTLVAGRLEHVPGADAEDLAGHYTVAGAYNTRSSDPDDPPDPHVELVVDPVAVEKAEWEETSEGPMLRVKYGTTTLVVWCPEWQDADPR